MIKRISMVAAFGAAVILLAGCTAAGGASGPAGVWGDPAGPNTPYLELAADGTVSGSDGCNRLAGSWEAEGDAVAFGPLASTLMFCEGVDTWLGGAASAEIVGSEMTVLDAGGVEIGTLERQD